MKTENDQDDRIRKAKAKIQAASLKQQAVRHRITAQNYRRQSRAPIYQGQEIVCANKAVLAEARADELDARAELLLAETGV